MLESSDTSYEKGFFTRGRYIGLVYFNKFTGAVSRLAETGDEIVVQTTSFPVIEDLDTEIDIPEDVALAIVWKALSDCGAENGQDMLNKYMMKKQTMSQDSMDLNNRSGFVVNHGTIR